MGVQALLVCNESESTLTLRNSLQQLSVATRQARSCEEARRLIGPGKQVDVIFGDVTLPDGDWAELVDLAKRAHSSAEVIVVSRLPDTRLYMEVMERGGFDFITPPFEQDDLRHLL